LASSKVETSDEILCHLEVPGMSRDDLQIRAEGNVLTVSGEKKFQKNEKQKAGGFQSFERRYGRLERRDGTAVEGLIQRGDGSDESD
jgi:HSP20 family protein